MCGRYRLSRRKQLVEEYFDSAPWDDDWNPRYNIAPTQPVPVIRQNPKEPVRELSLVRWGWTHTIMGARPVCRRQDDQRKVGDGSHEARIPRSSQASTVLDSGRRLLRMDADGESQTAVLF